MFSEDKFSQNLSAVRQRIAAACAACHREISSVKLLPVSKFHPAAAVSFAAKFNLETFGENRVQEAAEKRPLCPQNLRWELIGHLQSNKVKMAVATFDRIQTIDSAELAMRVNRAAADAGKIMPVLLQANASNDPAKFGAGDFSALQKLANDTAGLPNLKLEGLMTIPALDADNDTARRAFETLRLWRDKLEIQIGKNLPELSMGMSGDLEIAVAAGATIVRIGTAIFGKR